MSGAPALAALAALRGGAGVVWVCVPESERAAVAAHGPELMVHGELGAERVLELAARARAVVAGPGLGRAPGAAELVDALVRGVEGPLVLDADALFALAGRLETLRERPGPTALTPHAGELGRLLGRDSAAVAAARLASVSEAAEQSQAAVLLKGPDTLVVAPGEALRVVETPVPQLATAGAGDVLAGAVGALCARGLRACGGARAGRGRARIGGAHGRRRGRCDRRDRPAAAARTPARVTRSTLEVDLGAVHDECTTPDRGCGRQPPVGGRQGRRLWPRGDRVRRHGALGRRAAHLLRDAGRGARAARGSRRAARRSSCSPRSSPARRRASRASRSWSRRSRTTPGCAPPGRPAPSTSRPTPAWVAGGWHRSTRSQ